MDSKKKIRPLKVLRPFLFEQSSEELSSRRDVLGFEML